ncbi:PLD nuclease N-terminal domain-containing protein [Nocardioides pyridinolyticus]
MIKLELLLGVVTFALWVYCLVDAIGAQPARVRNLPKVAWIVLILFFPLIGSVAWLVAGRPDSGGPRRSPYEREVPGFPEYDRPGRAAAVDPAKDEEFLRQVRERAEAQRKAYEEKKKRERESESD